MGNPSVPSLGSRNRSAETANNVAAQSPTRSSRKRKEYSPRTSSPFLDRSELSSKSSKNPKTDDEELLEKDLSETPSTSKAFNYPRTAENLQKVSDAMDATEPGASRFLGDLQKEAKAEVNEFEEAKKRRGARISNYLPKTADLQQIRNIQSNIKMVDSRKRPNHGHRGSLPSLARDYGVSENTIHKRLLPRLHERLPAAEPSAQLRANDSDPILGEDSSGTSSNSKAFDNPCNNLNTIPYATNQHHGKSDPNNKHYGGQTGLGRYNLDKALGLKSSRRTVAQMTMDENKKEHYRNLDSKPSGRAKR